MARASLESFALPLLAACLAACVFTGCDDPDTPDPELLDMASVSEQAACDDLTVIAAHIDGNEALLLGIDDGLAAQALSAGEVVTAEYTLPDDRLTVRWAEGSNVYRGHCGLDNGEPWQVDAVFDGVRGTIAVRLVPHIDGSVTLSAEVEDLELGSLEDMDAPKLILDHALIRDIEL